MILPFLSIFFLIAFIFVLEKNSNNGGDNGNNHNEKKKKDEKSPMMTTVFKVNCQTCIDKIQELVLEFEGEMNFSAGKQKHWVIVNGIRDDIERLRKILNSPVEIVQSRKDKDGDKKKGPMTTAVFRFPVHCDRCIDKIRKMVLNSIGVTNVPVDMEKDLVIVNCTRDVEGLTEDLGMILRRKDKRDKKYEGEKGQETTTVFKVGLHCLDCINTIEKIILNFEGVTSMSVDSLKNLVTVTGTMDNIALTDSLRKRFKRFKRRVEVVPPEKDKKDKQSNEVDNGNDGSDDGDGDGDSSGSDGDKNKKKGNGGDGDSDVDDGDKGEGGGGGGKVKGFKMDCMGESGFDYRYGYHAGFENGYPVGQLHVGQMSNSENLNGKKDRQSNEVGNGNAHGSGIKGNNNGDGGGKTKIIKMDYMGQLSGLWDGGGQLRVAHMFCRESQNACSNIPSVVLV